MPSFHGIVNHLNNLSNKKVCKKQNREAGIPSSLLSVLNQLSLNSHNCTAIVCTASLASSVREYGLTALGALGNIGKVELPMSAAPLISSLSGNFTLRYCHFFSPPHYILNVIY